MTGAALIDTSVYVGREHGRPMLADPPTRAAVSVVTIAELWAGVLAAPDDRSRLIRQQTLTVALSTPPLLVDRPVAEQWAALRCAIREAKRGPLGNDLWIAATAVVHGLPLVTQDRDYLDVPGLQVIQV